MRDVDLIPGSTPTLRARVYAKIKKGKRNECWTWLGSFARKRGSWRPKIQVGGNGSRTLSVARVLLVLKDRVHLGDREAVKLEAAHTCDNPECVNPRHLMWKTRIENENDKYAWREFEKAIDDIIAEDRECQSSERGSRRARSARSATTRKRNGSASSSGSQGPSMNTRGLVLEPRVTYATPAVSAGIS